MLWPLLVCPFEVGDIPTIWHSSEILGKALVIYCIVLPFSSFGCVYITIHNFQLHLNEINILQVLSYKSSSPSKGISFPE